MDSRPVSTALMPICLFLLHLGRHERLLTVRKLAALATFSQMELAFLGNADIFCFLRAVGFPTES